MYDILGVGLALMDVVLTVETFPIRGGCAFIQDSNEFIGGCTANLLISASRLNLKTSLITKLGMDDVGKRILEKLTEYGIDCKYVKIVKGSFSGRVYTVMDQEGERTFFSMLPNSAISKFGEEDIDQDAITNSKVLFGDGAMFFDKRPARAVIKAMKIAKDFGVTVAFDPNIRIPGRRLPEEFKTLFERSMEISDILLLNEEEVKLLTGKRDLIKAVDYLRETGASLIGIKLGSKGCIVASGHKIIYCPAFDLKVVDIVGAGDAFNAGFIYGHLKGWDLERIGIFANAVGGLKVTRKGASSSPSIEEVFELIKSQPISGRSLV